MKYFGHNSKIKNCEVAEEDKSFENHWLDIREIGNYTYTSHSSINQCFCGIHSRYFGEEDWAYMEDFIEFTKE